VKKQKELVEKAAAGVHLPESPLDYTSFISQVSDAEKALAAAKDLPQELLAGHAKEIALKKQLFQEQISKLKSSELKSIAKDTQLKHWQWASKDDLVTLFTETDPGKIGEAHSNIESKWQKWAEKHGGKKAKTAPAKEKTNA